MPKPRIVDVSVCSSTCFLVVVVIVIVNGIVEASRKGFEERKETLLVAAVPATWTVEAGTAALQAPNPAFAALKADGLTAPINAALAAISKEAATKGSLSPRREAAVAAAAIAASVTILSLCSSKSSPPATAA